MSWKSGVAAIAVIAAAAVAIVLATGGGDGGEPAANDVDGAFIDEMTAHHRSAIEMARMATEQADHPQVEDLARSIIRSQGQEIAAMEAAHGRLFGGAAGSDTHASLSLTGSAMGMDMSSSMLAGARPFDREFIDMMIPHHQGAIRMARIERARGESPELRDMAMAIIDAQSREIRQMNRWRTTWYGAPSPAGGVPAATAGDAHDGSM
jgi:uncharacterized protein (DUF305 family)